MDPDLWLYVAVAAGVAGLLLALFFARQVLAAPEGNDRMKELSAAIRDGSMAFLRREYTWVAVFVAIMAVLIFTLLDYGRPWGAIAYVFGAVLSALAGFIGMRIATSANARTAEAARLGGVRLALPLAFRGGAVMGFSSSRSLNHPRENQPGLGRPSSPGLLRSQALRHWPQTRQSVLSSRLYGLSPTPQLLPRNL